MLFDLRAFGLKTIIPKKNFFFLSPTHFFFHSVPPCSISLLFILFSFRLHSVFLPSLSFRYIHFRCALLSLSPHSTFCTSFPLFPDNTCFLFSCSHVWISPSFFSLLHSLSLQALRNFLCHTPFILLVVSGFFDSFYSFLLFCVFVPFTQFYIHPSSFCSQSFHFFTGIPVPLVVFLSLLLLRVSSLLSSIPLVSCTLPFHPFFLQILPLSFPHSLSAHSSYTLSSPDVSLSTPSTPLKYVY
jgi:hypothetical protein